MNTMTARALMVGVLIAIWAWLASVARLNVSMWAGVVALGCFYASGGGVAGGEKTDGAGAAGRVGGVSPRGGPRRGRGPGPRRGGALRGVRARLGPTAPRCGRPTPGAPASSVPSAGR